MEAFLPLYAGLHKPWIGHGPHALDLYGYTDEYLFKYGAPEDYEEHMRFMQHYIRMGITPIGRIPAHSHIAGFFLWFGIVGGAYWLYCLYLMIRYFKNDIAAIPQWFGYLAGGAPLMLWNLFFSGLGYRIFTTLYFTAILLAHAVARGWLQLPVEMQQKIWEKEGQ